MSEDKKKDIDRLSGVETTGHEWDGLKELNNPLPRWWVWVWLISIVWSVWYFVVYPAWPVPGGATQGTSGYTQYKELAASQQEIVARQATYMDKFQHASFDEIMNAPDLYAFAIAGGNAAFKENCATCHGTGAEGGKGYPNLNDDDWLWGGSLEDIHTTIQHGIRAADEDTRVSQMPAFGAEGLLTKTQVNDVVDYVLALSKKQAGEPMPGHTVFAANCASCHGPEGKGGREFGAPNLSDSISLFGNIREDIFKTVFYGRAGVMPSWSGRMDEQTIRELTIYVHQLGGGEEAKAAPEEPVNEQ
jgi:cytochrome c oxidase cbb3-type subunit 3